MRILLAEDDELLGSGIRAGLAQNGFQVDWVRDGVAAERELATGAYQAAVLDLGLPRQDGMEVLRQVRARRNTTPVLVLTARDAVPARIAGLDAGADDYLIKPIDLHELAARLRALCAAHGQSKRLVAPGGGGPGAAPCATRRGGVGRMTCCTPSAERGRVLSRADRAAPVRLGHEVHNAMRSRAHLRRAARPIETVRGVGCHRTGAAYSAAPARHVAADPAADHGAGAGAGGLGRPQRGLARNRRGSATCSIAHLRRPPPCCACNPSMNEDRLNSA
jgi:CheY-like chemotaxis protein